MIGVSGLLAAIRTPAARYLGAVLLAVLLVGGAYVKGRVDGVAIERGRVSAEIEKARKERIHAEDRNRSLSDDELFDRLLPGRR